MKYQFYDDAVSAIADELRSKKPNQWKPYIFLRGAKLFRQYLEQENRTYSLQELIIWLDTNEQVWKHHTYKAMRHSLLLVAQRLDPEVAVTQLLYHNLPDYQQLPAWAVTDLENFHVSTRYQDPNGNICYESDRIHISKFLLWLIRRGLTSLSAMSITLVLEYCRDNGVQRGIKPFLCNLRDNGIVSAFLPESYSCLFCSRALSPTDLQLDVSNLLRFRTEGYDTETYWLGIQNTMSYLHDHHYSSSVYKALRSPMFEFGVFIELNGLYFSKELALAWRCALREKTGMPCVNARRGLLLVADILEDITGSTVHCSYGDKKAESPDWSKAILGSYLDERAQDGMSKSTLVMDHCSNRRFLLFLDSKGIKSIGSITVELIKEFHLQDSHSTAEGKNAYSSRIRGFLRYLARQELVPYNLDMALASNYAGRVRPAVILTKVQSEAINGYCEETKDPKYYRDVAVLNIATSLGLRSCDIANIRFGDIDWIRQEIALMQKKTKVFLRLPFSTAVGNSIYTYIMEGRPDISSDFVFISGRAPYAKMERDATSGIIARALSEYPLVAGRRSGFSITRKTFASQLLAKGTSFSTISDTLGHQDDRSVDTYLDTNTDKLRMCPMGLTGFEYKGVAL